jgi:hypothetical protein
LFGLVGAAIDAKFFPDNVFFDIYGLVFPSVFLPYMCFSDRVHRVFLTRDWDPEIGSDQPQTFAVSPIAPAESGGAK